MSRAELKQRAKDSLKGKYGEAIKILLLYYAISFAIGFFLGFLNLGEDTTNLLSAIVGIVVSGLFLFGYNNFFLKISRNEEVTYKELFSKTNLFLTCIALTFLIGIFTFLWSLLFIIPGIIAALNYSIAYFVALDNPEMGAMDVLRKSKELMYGHKMEYFILTLSFLGWAIVDLFTLGILNLWLVPYMQVTYANFYNEIKG